MTLKKSFDRVKDGIAAYAPAFAPGLFLITLGLVVCLAPTLVIGVMAGFFLFLGGMLCVLAWRVIQLKIKIEAAAKQFQSRVIVQGVNLDPDVLSQIEIIDQKKIVLH